MTVETSWRLSMLKPDAPSRRNSPLAWALLLGVGGLLAVQSTALADEGVGVFNNRPRKQLKEQSGVDPWQAWLQHLRSSAVRVNSGGTGAFVSPDGLVMPNHHVGADTLQKISTDKKDSYKEGFCARTREEEVKSPDL